jgi:hypothetical protein
MHDLNEIFKMNININVGDNIHGRLDPAVGRTLRQKISTFIMTEGLIVLYDFDMYTRNELNGIQMNDIATR